MPITFEEVTADVQREPSPDAQAAAPAPAAPPGDLPEQLDRELRLREQRQARLCAD